MADLLQNKPSSFLNVISTSLLQLLLMLLIFNYFYTPEVTTHEGAQVILIELSNSAGDSEREVIEKRLEDLSRSRIEFISKEQAWRGLTADLKSNHSDINPLKDLISIEVHNNPDIISEVESRLSDLAYIEIYGAEVSPADCSRPHLPRSFKLIPSVLLLLLAALAYFKYLFRVMRVNNRQLIESLELFGSDTSSLYNSLKKKVYASSFKGWLLGIFLFLGIVYLIYGSFGINNGDISTMEFVITLMAPLLITWIVATFMSRSAFASNNNL